MPFTLSKELRYSFILYFILVIIFLLVMYKTPYTFLNKNNKFKEFGTGEDKTVLPLWIYFIYGGFLIYIATITFIVE